MERFTIKSWAEEDRPREKLMLKGKHTLSDAELIAILLRSGSRENTAVELSKQILSKVGNNLNELSKLTVQDLMRLKLKGIGATKAVTIVAALELGRRRKTDEVQKEKVITSMDAVHIFQPLLGDHNHEEFWALFLNRANYVIGQQQISTGGMAGTVVDPKMIFRAALEQKAVSLVLCHNHPSGNIKPSDQDIRLTKNLVSAGKAIEISILDHIIISQQAFFSFADEGLL